LLRYSRTITPPGGAHSIGGSHALVLIWKPKNGAKQYKVQVSTKPDFSSRIDEESTDNPVFAPELSSYSYGKGGVFYWRVAAVDADGNSGDFTQTKRFNLLRVKHK
jgi:hypothetical protein